MGNDMGLFAVNFTKEDVYTHLPMLKTPDVSNIHKVIEVYVESEGQVKMAFGLFPNLKTAWLLLKDGKWFGVSALS